MAILANDLITDVANEIGDTDQVTWTNGEWVAYLNEAVLRVCLARPDASSTTTTFKLASGTKQSIPSTARRLLDITRNMGSDGNTPGKAITGIDKKTLDLYSVNWHKSTGKTYVDHFIYDEDTPKDFYVYPPVDSLTAVYIEAKLATNPAKISDPKTDNIPIDDVYSPALRHWMLHKAFTKETDSQISMSEARFHYQAFHDLLGLKTKTDISFSPSIEIQEAMK